MILIGIFSAYLIGSIPTAYLVGRAVRKIDIRTQGSGNVGATNVFRVVGKGWGIRVLIFDLLKGFVAAALLPYFFAPQSFSSFSAGILFGISAIAGHAWTVWLGFRGGKGVATSIGVLLALAPQALGGALLVWVILFYWKRYVSLASLGMALSFPFWVCGFYRRADFFPVLFPVSFILTFFIFYTHRANLQRLRQGTEKKIT